MNVNRQNETKFGTAAPELGLFIFVPVSFLCASFLGMLVFSGQGHGTPFFAQLFAAPLPGAMQGSWFTPLILWMPIALLMPLRHFAPCRVIAAILLLIHYYGTIALARETDWHFVREVVDLFSPFPALVLVFYGAVQAALLFLLVKAQWHSRRNQTTRRTMELAGSKTT